MQNDIPPMKQYHYIKPLQYNRTLYYKMKESIYINGKGEPIQCRLICFLIHCNEEDKQSIKRTTDNDAGRY